MARMRNKDAVKNIAFTVKQIREEKGITQEDILYDLGINVGRIEMGNNDMSCSTLIAICDKLGVSLVEFFKKLEEGTAQNFLGTNQEINIIQNYKS